MGAVAVELSTGDVVRGAGPEIMGAVAIDLSTGDVLAGVGPSLSRHVIEGFMEANGLALVLSFGALVTLLALEGASELALPRCTSGFVLPDVSSVVCAMMCNCWQLNGLKE